MESRLIKDNASRQASILARHKRGKTSEYNMPIEELAGYRRLAGLGPSCEKMASARIIEADVNSRLKNRDKVDRLVAVPENERNFRGFGVEARSKSKSIEHCKGIHRDRR